MRLQRALFDEGCIYVGVPPLYKVCVSLLMTKMPFPSKVCYKNVSFWVIIQVERGKQVHYCYDDSELKQLQSSFPSNASYNIQRFKGKQIKLVFSIRAILNTYKIHYINYLLNFLLCLTFRVGRNDAVTIMGNYFRSQNQAIEETGC